MAVAGFVAGGISNGIMSALKGEISLNAVLKGAAVGSTVSLAGGGALAYGVLRWHQLVQFRQVLDLVWQPGVLWFYRFRTGQAVKASATDENC